MTECDAIVNAFLRGLEGEFHVQRETANVCAITVPFETWDGDAIHVYVEKHDNAMLLTDEGETLGKVFHYNVRPEAVEEHIAAITRAHGVHREGQALVKIVMQQEELRLGFLDFIQAVQKVSALELRRRAERAQHFEVKVRNALTVRQVPYDAQWWPEAAGYPLPIDFASRNHHALFLALGTVSTGNQQLAYLRTKLFTYLDLKVKNLSSQFDRVVILDEATKWTEEAREMANEHADHAFDWPQQSEEVEAILTSNSGGLF